MKQSICWVKMWLMVHLKDFIPEDGKLRSVGCGLGQMDYTSVIEVYEGSASPFIHATLEDTTPENNVQVKILFRDSMTICKDVVYSFESIPSRLVGTVNYVK